MSDIFLYADETGNLDYGSTAGNGASQYFGFGTAAFDRAHGDELWNGMRLRAEISGVRPGTSAIALPKGFHAVNDNFTTRTAVFSEIFRQAPRFDATFLKKSNAYGYVRAKGEMYLYQYAWYRHLTKVAPLVAGPEDTLYVIVATLGTARRQTQALAALDAVCRQTGLKIVLCVWDSATSWGLQVADYGLWAMQRKLERNDNTWHGPFISPTLRTISYPWGI